MERWMRVARMMHMKAGFGVAEAAERRSGIMPHARGFGVAG
jgi:hypothetical protein